MPEISHKKLADHLSQLRSSPEPEFDPVYLIYGEELLVKNAYKALIDVLIPAASGSLNFEPLDGTAHSVHDVIERINTYSLLPGDKVVAFRGSKIFYTRQDKNRLLQKAKEHYDNKDLKRAATDLLYVLAQLNLAFDDISPSQRGKSLGLNADLAADSAWLDEIIEYCREQRLEIPPPQDDCSALQAAVERGFPRTNHLIITSDIVDKRRRLYKAIDQAGLIVNCAVPAGERRADKLAQEAVLKQTLESMLQAADKRMNHAAYRALYNMTGFDLRTFSSNIEKLIDYVGDRQNITIEDVEKVIQRTKKDPIYDLTNAISDKKVDRALFYLSTIIAAEFHPLQVLAAIANQIRKLLVAKDFTETPYGENWHPGCTYNLFQKNIMPKIVAYDADLSRQIGNWDDLLSSSPVSPKRKSAKPRKKKTDSDLIIAKNPKNYYPVYQLLKKTDHFTKKELSDALESVNEADIQLKSTRHNPKLVLEKVIFQICRRTHSA
jgi:DNA polymerase-3 subunit delta